MTNDVDHLFMFLIIIHIPLAMCQFKSFAHFFIELFGYLSSESYLYILDTSILSVMYFENILYYFVGFFSFS